jgi:hypothetical protein
MERECFSDPEIARQINDGFVSIKLDREERPDVDEIYMAATQLITRSGGWPNSLFLTHDLKPFFAGTYFPPTDRSGRPGFPRVLTSLREAWALRRAEVLEQAEVVAAAIREQMGAVDERPRLPEPGVVTATQASLSRRFDAAWGGFGGAPKFPSPSNLFFLLDRAREGDEECRQMLVVTLDRMARGGIHDQIAGGFHRYSTDAEWLVPHFEKMLYDNAGLALLYAESAPLAPGAGFERVARATLDFVLREMTGPEGAFLSAIDAETDGHEGAYYTWTHEELERFLDPESRALFMEVYGVDGRPNFESDRYVLHLPVPLGERAGALGLSTDALLAKLEPSRRALLGGRNERKRPLTDDKILADWNGLMIAAMARAGHLLGDEAYVAAARRAADFVLGHLRDASGRLLHAYRGGSARVPALLDDYAFFVDGLLSLHAATGEGRWLDEASRLEAEQGSRLGDAAGGGYFAAPESGDLLVRSKPAHDGAVASGNGVSALNLMALATLRRDTQAAEAADRLLAAFGRGMDEWPHAHVTLVRAAMRRGFTPLIAHEPPAVRPSPVADVARAASQIVEVRGSLGSAPGSWKPFAVELTIATGWHLNANPTLLRFLVPTEIKPAAGALRGIRYPATDRYEGHVRIEGEIEIIAGPPPAVSLTYQPCDEERCLTPVTRDVPLR